MKLKYYLRGLGIGIIVTTIILAISFSDKEVEISDAEIIARATILGMVMPEESEDADEVSTERNAEDLLKEAIAENSEWNMPQETEDAMPLENNTAVTEDASEDDGAAVTEDASAQTDEEKRTGVYRLVIQKGDVCRVICEALADNDVITDAEALRAHLFKLGYANNISTGTYDIPYGLTMEEVAQIIVSGPAE